MVRCENGNRVWRLTSPQQLESSGNGVEWRLCRSHIANRTHPSQPNKERLQIIAFLILLDYPVGEGGWFSSGDAWACNHSPPQRTSQTICIAAQAHAGTTMSVWPPNLRE